MTAHSKKSIFVRLAAPRELVPLLVATYPDDADFMPAFASVADDIVDDARHLGYDDFDGVLLTIESILHGAGKIPDGQLQT